MAGLEELGKIFEVLSSMNLDLDRYRLDVALGEASITTRARSSRSWWTSRR